MHTAPETVGGGPPSYICRLSGVGPENWKFWLEVNSKCQPFIYYAFVLFSTCNHYGLKESEDLLGCV